MNLDKCESGEESQSKLTITGYQKWHNLRYIIGWDWITSVGSPSHRLWLSVQHPQEMIGHLKKFLSQNLHFTCPALTRFLVPLILQPFSRPQRPIQSTLTFASLTPYHRSDWVTNRPGSLLLGKSHHPRHVLACRCTWVKASFWIIPWRKHGTFLSQ